MDSELARIEHLKLIQTVINRMTQCSFIIKGWTITLITAILGFSISLSNGWIGLLALIPSMIFWVLDAYYLRLERMFRILYDNIRTADITIDLFSMDINLFKSQVSLPQTCRRPAILFLYLPIVLTVLIISLIIILT